MRRSISILLCFFLISCSGTGTKDSSAINSMVYGGDKGKVFVGRVPGYFGSAQTYKVILNGKEIGILGAGEVIIGNTVAGTNLIEAKFRGLTLGLTIGEKIYSFNAAKNENHYFIVSYRPGVIAGGLELIETTASSFRLSMQ